MFNIMQKKQFSLVTLFCLNINYKVKARLIIHVLIFGWHSLRYAKNNLRINARWHLSFCLRMRFPNCSAFLNRVCSKQGRNKLSFSKIHLVAENACGNRMWQLGYSITYRQLLLFADFLVVHWSETQVLTFSGLYKLQIYGNYYF